MRSILFSSGQNKFADIAHMEQFHNARVTRIVHSVSEFKRKGFRSFPILLFQDRIGIHFQLCICFAIEY